MAPSGRKKGKEVDRSPTSILKHGDYTVSLTSWLAGGPVVLGKKPRRVIDLKVERDRKSETSDQSLVLARKDHDAAASDMEVGTSGSEGALTHTSRQRREPKGSSQPAVSSKPFLTYEEKRVEKFTIRPPPVVFNTPEDVPTGWLEAMLNQRKNGESSKAVSKKAISYEHNDSEDYEAGYDSPPHNKSKLLPKKSSSASRKASEIRIETKSSSKKGTRKVKVITADATDESDESLSDVESRRPMKTKKLERRSMTKERIKKKMHVEVSDEETADKVTTDIESSDIESTDVEPRSKPTSKKKPSTSSKKAGSSKVKVETRGRKGKRKVVVEASSEEEDSSVESMTEAEPSPLKKVKNKNRVTVTETTRKGKKKTITVESSDEADIAHVKSRSSQKGKKSEIRVKTSDKTKAKKVTFEPTDEPETTDDATTDAEPTPAKAQKGKGKSRTKAKKKIEVESPDPAETTNAVTTDDATQTEAETTDADTTVAEKPKGTPAAGKADNDWTPSQDASILSMKEGGEPWANIGSAIGRNKNEVKKRHQELVRLGAAQVNKGNQSKAHKTQNKKNKNNEAGPSHASVADETMGFRELPGFGFDADQDNSNNNDNNNNGDGWSGGGDQNNNTDNNGGGGEGAWGGGNQTDNNGGGDVGPGFDTPAWSADCTGGGDQDTNNNNNSNNDTNNNGFGDAGWGGGDQENNGGGNVGPGPGDGWAADFTGGDKPPSNSGSKNGSNQGKPPSNKPPSNSGNCSQNSNQGNNGNNKPTSNSGGGGNNGGSNQGNKPPSNNGQGGSSNQGNKPPSNSGNNGWSGGSNQGNKPPSNSGNNGWSGGSNQGNKPPSNSGNNGWSGGSNQGNKPPSSNQGNRPPSNNGDWGSGSNQVNNNNVKPPSNAGSAKSSNYGKPPSNNGGWGSGSNSGNKPPSNNGNWGGGPNQGSKPPSDSGGWNNGGSNQGGRPPSNTGGWGSSSNYGNNNNTKPPSNSGWGGGSNHDKPPSNGGGWDSGSNNGNKPPSNNGSNRGSGSQQGDEKAKSVEKELSMKDQEIKDLKERVSAEKMQRLEAEVFALRIQNRANRLNQNKQSEDGMGWNTGGSDNNWRPPSAAGSTRSNKPPDNNTGWKSGPGSDQGWSVAPNPGYKPPSNSGWVPKNFVPPQGSKPPSNTAPPGSPDGWIYGSPTESERGRMAKRVEAWKGSISSPKEQGHWGMPDGGWHATPATDSRPREIAPDNTRGRSPAARSTSAKDWKQGLTRVDEEPDTGYDVWKKPPSNNGKPGSNAGRNSPGNFNNKPSGEQYGWNSGPDAVAGTGTGWGGGSDRVSTPSFKHPAKDEWTGGTKGNDKPPSNKPPSNKPPSNNGDWTPGLGAATGWKADCTKPPSNSGWGGGSNQGKDNNKPPSNAGSARGSNYGKPPSNNGGWNYAPIGGTSKNNNRNNNKATGGNDSLTAFLQNPPPWGADCTGPWDSNKPANNKADKGDVQNALNIHMVRDLPGYNRDVAPMGLSGFPPVVEHYAPVPVPPVTPGPPGRYPSTPYSATPHPPGYLPKSEAQTTLLPLYNNSPPQAQYPSHDAPWNSTSWDTKPAVTTKPPGGPSSYQPGQRSAQCKTLSEEDLRSLYKQVVFSAMSSRQPLLQPKPDRDFTLRDCWVLISLSEQYDHSSASKEKWFELQAKFASATGRMVDVKLLRQKVKQGEKEAKVVEGWEDDEVGWRYKKKWEMETAW
ncbi:hypothetical protein NEUTE2DRAFT_155487 [Neurospora tetrasperma FGSC 2509]|nr:hypothetical protein NEUTE2DRAFT_155487 [Neurospora tetrasperma FGSC 2509]